MNLKEFLDINWKAVKMYLDMEDNYIPGAIFYKLTEMDIEGFVPKTYISKKLLKHKNLGEFKKQTTRFNLNKTAKKYFGNDAFIEHMVPKKFILEKWKECKDKNAFEAYLREETSICILLKSEEKEKKLTKTKGRENFADALKAYKCCGIEIEKFCFDFEKK